MSRLQAFAAFFAPSQLRVFPVLSSTLATFIYAISTFHCMSISLANGGPGPWRGVGGTAGSAGVFPAIRKILVTRETARPTLNPITPSVR